ncbi:MAG: DHH family phosphoesterase, partial [Pseudoflavonifractor sp.]|nr:DHH family phosphoesterase [Pseudoflavonifractor sp.]
MKYKRWNVASPCPEAQEELEKAGLSPLLAAVLSARRVQTWDQARRLLAPEEEPLIDPMEMKDMDRAVCRLRLALDRQEHIAVYGDYDVDGITSTCLLTQCLQNMGGQVIPYIPGRLEEGYGLNREALSVLAGHGVSLVITVDCGITAVDEVNYAKALGIDVVITDHHACKDAL